jgi:hypothetical protein
VQAKVIHSPAHPCSGPGASIAKRMECEPLVVTLERARVSESGSKRLALLKQADVRQRPSRASGWPFAGPIRRRWRFSTFENYTTFSSFALERPRQQLKVSTVLFALTSGTLQAPRIRGNLKSLLPSAPSLPRIGSQSPPRVSTDSAAAAASSSAGSSKPVPAPYKSTCFVVLSALLLLAGCAHTRPAQDGLVAFRSPGIERCLQYWTAHNSDQPTNHFYVWPTSLDGGNLVEALVYWREGGRILDYLESPPGKEAQAWRLRPKVDRSTLVSDESVSLSNDLVSHTRWVHWMNQCITHGTEYVVTLAQAKTQFPSPK